MSDDIFLEQLQLERTIELQQATLQKAKDLIDDRRWDLEDDEAFERRTARVKSVQEDLAKSRRRLVEVEGIIASKRKAAIDGAEEDKYATRARLMQSVHDAESQLSAAEELVKLQKEDPGLLATLESQGEPIPPIYARFNGVPLTEAVFRQLEETVALHRRNLEEFEETQQAPNSSTSPMQWKGTKKEFGRWILDQHRQGRISASSPTDALKQACRHFIDKDGEPFKPMSVWNMLQRDADEGIGTDYARKS